MALKVNYLKLPGQPNANCHKQQQIKEDILTK